MHGLRLRASENKSRTRAAPRPPIISINSDPFIERKDTEASVAIALASIVFPQPGGPKSKTPFGILAPKALRKIKFIKKFFRN